MSDEFFLELGLAGFERMIRIFCFNDYKAPLESVNMYMLWSSERKSLISFKILPILILQK
jgi:hypothetical protein